MSIATQIERLQNAKESIKQKLIEKGVEVSDDVKLDQYGELIDTIPSGGGESTLKKLLDATKTTSRLFSTYKGSSVDDLISYSDTENVTSFTQMFAGCASITSIPQLDTGNGTNFSYMFQNCTNITSIPQLDTGNGTDFRYMFYACTSITSIPQLDTGNGTNFTRMFQNCTNITSIPQLDTGNGTNFSYMFYACRKTTSIPQLDTGNGTDFTYMFADCRSITSIPQLDTGNGTNFIRMFQGCENITSIPQLDIGNGTSLYSIFYGCLKLTKAELSKYNISNASSADYIFYNCYSLKTIIIRSFGEAYSIGSKAFTNCYHFNPNGDKDGYIYVPRNMVDTLKSATNWSVYADQIRALEDYTVDGTTTGDLDMNKVNAPSQQEGYNVNLDPDAYVPSNKMFYSLDNGTTWLDLISIKDRENPILTGVTQIKFKANSTMLYCEELGMALEPMVGEEESENYTLSQDITISTM